jgi:hypothetical protein
LKFISKIILVAIVLSAVAIFTFTLTFGDHTNRKNFRIYSLDKEQCVTIITYGNNRYIINGKASSIPKSDFVKLDISGIDKLGDGIGICWKNEKYEWQISNDNSVILENKLDTTKYKFITSWEKDEFGQPNTKKYLEPNCGTLDLLSMDRYPENGNLIVEK